MKQFDVKEYRKMCAEFLGLTVIPVGTESVGLINFPEVSEAFLDYDVDWNSIMEMIEKIESLKYEFIFYCHYNWVEPHRVVIRTYRNEEIIYISSNDKKEAVVQAIWEFLIWYQEQSKNE